MVVTGHEAEKVEATIADLPVTLVRNPHYAEGLSTSLKAAIEALPNDVDGAVVCLADHLASEAGAAMEHETDALQAERARQVLGISAAVLDQLRNTAAEVVKLVE